MSPTAFLSMLSAVLPTLVVTCCGGVLIVRGWSQQRIARQREEEARQRILHAAGELLKRATEAQARAQVAAAPEPEPGPYRSGREAARARIPVLEAELAELREIAGQGQR